jgi:hypothetical protein
MRLSWTWSPIFGKRLNTPATPIRNAKIFFEQANVKKL